jgi:hypothetical protein
LAIGKGGILRDAVFSAYDPDGNAYRTVSGVVLVLTHECDVEVENDRLYNESVLVCPLIPLEAVVEAVGSVYERTQLVSFLTNLGGRYISRLAYFPPVPGVFDHGSVLYLNEVSHAPVERLKGESHPVCSLSAFGLREMEYTLENHLLRPKDERLQFMPFEAASCTM